MKIANMQKINRPKDAGKFRAWFAVDFGTHIVSDWRLYEVESGFWAAAPRYNLVRPDGRHVQARPVQIDEKNLTIISLMAGEYYLKCNNL